MKGTDGDHLVFPADATSDVARNSGNWPCIVCMYLSVVAAVVIGAKYLLCSGSGIRDWACEARRRR